MLAANAANARRLGLQLAPLDTLERLQDIDTVQDLRCWCARQQGQEWKQDMQAGREECAADDSQRHQHGQHAGSMQAVLEVALRAVASPAVHVPSLPAGKQLPGQ